MKAYAHVNWGRWVVECPNPGCRSATQVAPTKAQATDRVPYKRFECPCPPSEVCNHSVVCGQSIEPAFPRDRRKIETVLEKRPAKANRNWYPGETVDLLTAENIEHGVN